MVLEALSLLRVRGFLGGYDLGYFRQAAWLITHGREAFVTVRGLHLLGDHASFVFWPIAQLTRVFPTVPTLLTVQAGALALGVVPLYAFARTHADVGRRAALALAGAYVLYPALQNVAMADFHPEVVAVPALFGAVLFAVRRQWIPFAACIAVVLSCREDLAITVTALGAVLMISDRRRAGGITAAVGLVVLWLDVSVVMPHFADGFVQSSFLSRYGSGLGEIARTMATHPWRVLDDLMSKQNADFVVHTMGPLVFLPLVRPRWLLPAVPLQVLYLLSERPAAHTIFNQYTVGLIPFAFLAAAVAVGSFPVPTTRTVCGALLAGSVLFWATVSNGGPSANPWRSWTRDETAVAKEDAARLVPERADVIATSRLWPLLADRPNLYPFPAPLLGYDSRRDPVPLAERQRRVGWLVVDTVGEGEWGPTQQASLDRILAEFRFEERFDRAGIHVYERVA